MSLRTQWPYAAKAIIQHEWVVNLIYVWVTFKFPMNESAKPHHDLWLCEVDGAPKAITVSSWQDAFTLLLTVPDVLALPSRVTLEYDGPSVDLKITWNKQWEPWGPILSNRVPFLWEDILVVDTVLKRVGVQPGVAATDPLSYSFTVVSPDGDFQAGFYQTNDQTEIRLGKGILDIRTDEGINTNTFIHVKGKGTGRGYIYLYDEADNEYLNYRCAFGLGYFSVSGPNPMGLLFQAEADLPVSMFEYATEGEIEKHKVYGWKAGDTEGRHVDLQISPNANNTALWSGVGDYVFDGNIRATGRLVSGTLTHSAVGPTDNLDVSDVNTVLIDCSGGNVTIGGFVGGVIGQTLELVRLCAAANDATLEHNEAHAFQKIFLHKGLDETLTGEYGGWTLKCNGTSWFDTSHAKHV